MGGWNLEILLCDDGEDLRAGEPVRGAVRVTPGSGDFRALTLRWICRIEAPTGLDLDPHNEAQWEGILTRTLEDAGPQDITFELPAPPGPLTYFGQTIQVTHRLEASADVASAMDPTAERPVHLHPGALPRPTASASESVAEGATHPGRYVWHQLIGGTVLLLLGLFVPALGQTPRGIMMLAGLALFWGGVQAFRGRGMGGVEVEAPTVASPGEAFDVTARCSPTSDLTGVEVTATLKGVEVRRLWAHGTHGRRKAEQAVIETTAIVLAGPGSVSSGSAGMWTGNLTVPATTAWSFHRDHFEVAWTLEVRFRGRGADHTVTRPVVVAPEPTRAGADPVEEVSP